MNTLNQKQIDALDEKAFAEYAKEAFGIVLDPDKGKDKMLKAFKKAGGEIAEDDGDQGDGNPKKSDPKKGVTELTPAAHAAALKNERDPMKHPRHYVTILNQEGPGGGDDVFLSVNGRALQVKRGHKVAIPKPYLDMLNDAKRTEYEQVSEDGKVKTLPRQVLAVAFTDHGPVADAEGDEE